MRGPDLLLAHLAFLPDLDEDVDDTSERPSARERLDAVLGADVAERALAAVYLSGHRSLP